MSSMRISASGPGALPVPSEAPKVAPAAESRTTQPDASTTPAEGPSPFARVLHGLGHEITSGEHLMRSAESSLAGGADMSPGELIALQVGVYRYSDAVDMASRLVDRLASGVKTVIQGSGQ